MPTSSLQALRSHAVAVSAGLPDPMLHGVATLQMITLLIGAAEAGPKLGTASGPWPVGVGLALGDALGEVLAGGDGVAPPVVVLPRPERTMPPTVPSSRITTTAMMAGISHDGRSAIPPPAGLRATARPPAGAIGGLGGVRVGGGVRAGVAAATAGAEAPPGFHAGASTGAHVCCAGAGVKAAGGAGAAARTAGRGGGGGGGGGWWGRGSGGGLWEPPGPARAHSCSPPELPSRKRNGPARVLTWPGPGGMSRAREEAGPAGGQEGSPVPPRCRTAKPSSKAPRTMSVWAAPLPEALVLELPAWVRP